MNPTTNASITAVNDCLRHLTWVKSDLASIRHSEPAKITFAAPFSQPNPSTSSFGRQENSKTYSFGVPPQSSKPMKQEEQQPIFQSANTNLCTKRRIDILATPQFAEVIRYVMAFDDSSEILSLLWSIADGPSNKEDLDILINYVKILKLDTAMQSLKVTCERQYSKPKETVELKEIDTPFEFN